MLCMFELGKAESGDIVFLSFLPEQKFMLVHDVYISYPVLFLLLQRFSFGRAARVILETEIIELLEG